jgi:hypothetical protein
VLVELMSPENVELLGTEHTSETIVSPSVLSHILTQVALRREVHAVYAELFDAAGAELMARKAAAYVNVARETSFGDLQNAAADRNEIAVGVRIAGRVILTPSPNDIWKLADDDQLLVVAGA